MDMEVELGAGIESQTSQDENANVLMLEDGQGATATGIDKDTVLPTSQASQNDLEKKSDRKEISSRSEVWQQFIKIKDDKGILRNARCRYCHRNMKADLKSNGTSALKRHFNICKRNPHKFNKDSSQGTIQACQGEPIGTWRFDQDELRAAFAKMVIEDEFPFCVGEKPGLRKFMAKAYPRFQLPSRRTCTRDVVRCFFQERAKLKKFLKDSCQRVCLTTDCWTSQQLVGYMTVTASWIDESWTLHKKVIGFFMTKGHKGEDIGKNMMRCLSEWGLESVMMVIVDNASSNDNGISYLKKQLSKTNIASGKYMQMRCAAHIVNLIVQDGLKEVDLSVKHVRAAVKWIQGGSSSSRMLKFKEIVEEEKLTKKPYMKLDVPTPWNSTYIMLKAAIAYEKVFTRLGDDDMGYVMDLSEAKDGYGHPDEDDWANAKKMAEFLEHFHDLTERVSATLHVTSHTLFHEIGEVHLLIQSWLNSTDALQVSMAKRMKDKFDKYWGLWHIPSNDNGNPNDKEKGKGKAKEKDKENMNLLIFVAGCLDPRYKLSLYTKITIEEIFGEEKGQIVWEAVHTCVHELFEEYRKLYSTNEDTTKTSDATSAKGSRGGKLREVVAKKMKVNRGSSINVKSEIENILLRKLKM